MADGGSSYWTLRRTVRANVERHLENIQEKPNEPNYDQSPLVSQSNVSTGIDNQSCVNTGVHCSHFESDIESSDMEIASRHNSSVHNNISSDSAELVDDFESYFDKQQNLNDSDSEENSSSDDESYDLKEKLREWAVKYQIPNISLSELLTILRHVQPCIPKDPRTLLKTKTKYNIMEVGGGDYYHFGIVDGIVKQLLNETDCIPDNFCIRLQINIDGLPLFKSSSHQFWPILGKMQNPKHSEPFVIGLFSETHKPNNLDDYLKSFIDEYVQIERNGFSCEGKHLHLEIHSIICDAPARAFIKKVKSFSGYHGCDKCIQEGVWEGKMTFPETNSPLRTDTSFDEMRDDDHHTGISPLSHLDIGLVSQVPIDYMHLVCLGVMRRLLLLWMKGPLICRLGAGSLQHISDHLLRLREFVPSEFARKPRSLFEIERWKATEFRQFLLYTGPIVLFEEIHENLYGNFLLFFIGMHILLNENLSRTYNSYAHDLLVAFVRHFYQIYGNNMAVYNVHGLVHLAEEAKLYGSLDNISAFPFENFLSKLKRLVRKPTFPLPQVIRRLSERTNHVSERPCCPVLKQNHKCGPVPTTLLAGTQYRCVKTDKEGERISSMTTLH